MTESEYVSLLGLLKSSTCSVLRILEYKEASCLCPLFSLPTCYVLGEETTFPSALAFHIHLAQDTIIQLLPWILCLFFPAGFKIPHLYSWNIEHL
ncbi:hypothetical protein JHK82_038336 [Glycine max]|nr:hypothetical protein JHK87_038284 [Glycine soja]KAG4971651.1 hypothetical protein JHK85_038072 [Glycine max]KAG4972662.1 hypothetical protein JHK85_039083 [Glycine max]KAG4978040.1 hypothetical protein JHK86_037514 [Glycine max]KAG4979046.1 hypothetical protein JHK86_038520 [Glycine max]